MAFAQQPKDFLNVTRNVKKLASGSYVKCDSIVTDGWATKVYEYSDDGSYTETDLSRGGDGAILSKSVSSYDSKGNIVSCTSYMLQGGELVPFIGFKYLWDTKGNIVSYESYSHNYQMNELVLSGKREYRIDEETNDSIDVNKTYDGEGRLRRIVEHTYDVRGHELFQTSFNVENDKEIPDEKFEFSADGGCIYYKWQDGKWAAIYKIVYTHYDNGNHESYKRYEYNNGEYKLTNYVLYDEKENSTEEFSKNVKTIYKNLYADDGRLKEKVGSKVVDGVETPDYKAAYTYFAMEGGSYYYRVDSSSSNDGGKTWSNSGYEYYVPTKEGYAKLSIMSINGYDKCFFYSVYEGDVCMSDAIYTIINDELVCVDLRKYTYNEYNDFARIEVYENPKYAEGGSLKLVKTTIYEYDQNTPNEVFMAKGSHLNLLSCYTTDADGKETSRSTYSYYYSEHKPTNATGITSVASSDKAQAIYNLNGQKVASTQAGQIYIQNGRKFIAK